MSSGWMDGRQNLMEISTNFNSEARRALFTLKRKFNSSSIVSAQLVLSMPATAAAAELRQYRSSAALSSSYVNLKAYFPAYSESVLSCGERMNEME